MDEELKALLLKAQENLDATQAKYTLLLAKQTDAETKGEEIATQFATQATTHAEAMDEMKNVVADLNLKIKSQRIPGTKLTKGDMDVAIQKSLGSFMRNGTIDKTKSVEEFRIHMVDGVKNALNLTETSFGLESVDEVLSAAIIERARESYPIVGQVGVRNMPRVLREEVLISFPSVQKGLESVAGTDIAETDVQAYGEVLNHIAKLNAKPRITDEAMMGSDLDLYGQLMRLLDEEMGRYIGLQILFGDGSSKAMRGILSSNRINITNGTGESFKPTFGNGSRDLDFYPVIGTGVSGDVPATDKELVDWLIDFTTALPSKYLNGAKWEFNRKFMNRIMKVRDADERPIFAAGYMGETLSLLGYPIVLDDDMPNYTVANAPFLIFGKLNEAFYMSPGAIDKFLPDPYSVDGCTVMKIDKEFYEIVGKNDAIIIGAATTAGPA
jgi:HK97 family phage major capsid protein